MIDSVRLLEDLQKQVAEAETDLQAQLGRLPEVAKRLRAEYDKAFKVGKTSAALPRWIEERVTQSAVAWVLGTVFVRFCEDNHLLHLPFLAGTTTTRETQAQERHGHFMAENPAHTHRDWLYSAFEEIGDSPAGRLLFDKRHNPLYQIPLSNEGAKKLLDFWRLHEETEEGGTGLVHDFGSDEWDTRFLGDIYQDLSQDAQEKYALFQTPEFVEQFILDRTLKKALAQIGYDVVKMIDPTCGSGHFLLGAFHQILGEWERRAPNDDVHTRVAGALDAIHGVDLNPFAVAIARFRLIIAALKAAGVTNLRETARYKWPLHVATGDALFKSQQGKLFDASGGEVRDSEDYDFWFGVEDLAEHLEILTPGRYHVVVGNPPYIAVKDSKLRDTYRSLYRHVCHGRYTLSVPFMQRFFELAKRDESGAEAGYVGQITSSAFMKREFGEKLVEGYLNSAVDLTEVIDSSGAYIPHHGTPTVIVVGRNRPAASGAKTVRTVRGVQGEPGIPDEAAQGHVWRDIVERIDDPGKSVGDWVSVDNLDREKYFGRHPWILADGGVETIDEIDRNSVGTLKKSWRATVGITSVTGEDDLYLLPRNGAVRRLGIESYRSLVSGDAVRDFQARSEFDAIWTYDENFKTIPFSGLDDSEKILSAGKSVIRHRRRFGTPMVQRGLAWYEWQELYSSKLENPLSIVYAEVATHNHFALDRGDKVFKQTAPVIKLAENLVERDYVQLLGVLNSSAACFWLKQMCHIKPSNGVGRGLESEKWTVWSQFNSTNVREFPLPEVFPLARATELDNLAQQLAAVTPLSVAADPEKLPTADVLAGAKVEWNRIRARMIAVQEELDWEVYGIYGLHADLTAPEGSLPVEGLVLGQRAFEIDLGRRVKDQSVKTEWFRRHKSQMITEIPADWPEAYKETVRRRLEAMKNSSVIGLIERPEYKRRWLTDEWDVQQQAALKEWLLARMESRELWYETDYDGTERPRTRSLPELVDDLTRDHDFVAVAELYAPGEELSVIIPKLVEDQHVPFLAALRYTETAHKKKREVWEQVWERQRQEDAATADGDHLKAMEIRDGTPVPPKYTTADYRKASYAAQRGGLDVPKERFISYSRTLNPAIEVLGWGGWDHLEQAAALTETIEARTTSGNWEREDFIPYLAGLLELLPWLRQWHPEDAGMFEEALLDWQREEEFAVTDEELRAWRPARKTAKKAAAKPAGGKSRKAKD
ncbi:BREX-2 system adenine-specific DNA-methyltransferase PglX [Streptomyces sp. BB1-1-1]|uniref:BREX-2 system adenine-specific DNA-methyltransferase PglX n=1 Tax=Streptomyces sp. BB1-1-1 TaxID=3074430 RepID=UPI00287808A8|nr:BREX-2 system adenine-specific DNA-methyltransferase PglX [Streptomyces sp. BB1-1-1]WND37131.1 BREX-2 system adenine-specific DNA-methyltransferase PglX [Streptomyces sp. BB1-1-1]